jgi:hypothetical protein
VSSLLNSIRFSYAFRTGTLSGAAARCLVQVTTRSSADHIAAWAKQQELRAGQWNPYDHTFVPPGGRAALGRVLRLSRMTGPAIASRSFARACDAVNLADALFVDDGAGGCFMHGWPPCRCARCIVVPHGMGEIISADDDTGTLTIVG